MIFIDIPVRNISQKKKIRIVLEGLRGEDSIAELCRREGINSNVYYRWSKDFLEADKKRLSGNTVCETTFDEVKGLRAKSGSLKRNLGRSCDGESSSQKKHTRHGEDDT